MIVRELNEVEKTDKRKVTKNWESTRMLVRKDGVGFSFHMTTIYAGTETPIWYKNHFESVYCIEGEGEIELLPDGPTYQIKPGTMYVLDGHEKHLLRAKSNLSLACVFNPPCSGNEEHDEDGAYLLSQGQERPVLEKSDGK